MDDADDWDGYEPLTFRERRRLFMLAVRRRVRWVWSWVRIVFVPWIEAASAHRREMAAYRTVAEASRNALDVLAREEANRYIWVAPDEPFILFDGQTYTAKQAMAALADMKHKMEAAIVSREEMDKAWHAFMMKYEVPPQ